MQLRILRVQVNSKTDQTYEIFLSFFFDKTVEVNLKTSKLSE